MFGFLRRKKVDPKKALKEALGDQKLPTFPGTVLRTLEKIRDEEVPLQEIAELVSIDPGLTVRLLRTVNSAAYAVKREVRSVRHAVALLGRGQLESLLLSVAVRDALPHPPGFNATRFWRAAARRASTARSLASVLHPATQSESFTAALLQDMAVPMLHMARGAEYVPVFEAWHASGDVCLSSLERSEFGWDHTEVATWMCDSWAFPEPLAAAISGHHNGDEPLSPPAVLLSAYIRETDDADTTDRLVSEVEERYGVPADDVVALVAESFEAAEEIARLMVG